MNLLRYVANVRWLTSAWPRTPDPSVFQRPSHEYPRSGGQLDSATSGPLPAPGKHGCRIDALNQPPGFKTVDVVDSARSRSSMSMSAMLQTTPSNGSPSHQSVVVTSPST